MPRMNDQWLQSVRMNGQEVQEEEEGPWEGVKRRRWEIIRSRRVTTDESRIEVKKKKKKVRVASVIIWESKTSCFRYSYVFNESLFSMIKKPNKEKRQWDALPSIALLNIFCKSELKERLQSIPLVCKSWKYVTDDHRCWSSMIPDSVSPEDAFIKNTSGYEFESYPIKSYRKPVEKDGVEEEVPIGLSRLRTLIKKSGGGAAITTLYLSPFLSAPVIGREGDKILHLIANCCPNLKHISLATPDYNEASIEEFCSCPNHCPNPRHISLATPDYNEASIKEFKARLRLFNRCKKLELVDLDCFGYNAHDDDDTLVIQEIGNCLPNLRGIRIRKGRTTTVSIATYLPQLKLLSLCSPYLNGEHLSAVLFSYLELQYLYVIAHRWLLNYRHDIVDQASAQIPECYFERRYDPSWYEWSFNYYCFLDGLESMEELERKIPECYLERYNDPSWYNWSHENYYYMKGLESMNDPKRETVMDGYLCILKQRKEEQYVSMLKKDRNVPILKKKVKYYHILKKKKRDQCNSRLKNKKKKYQYDSTVRKKKKDQCDYADYVIR